MKSAALPFVLAVLTVCAPVAALNRDQAATTSPVEKVVKLLTELKERIGVTEAQEQQIYEKYACWCEKTTARKAKNIEDAEVVLEKTGQAILKYKAQVATLMAEIQKLEEEIAANKQAQAEATALRRKQNAAYMGESVETKQALAALEDAIAVLVKATGGKADLIQELQEKVSSLPVKAFALLSPKKAALLQTFAASSYAPQSISIQGILSDMYATFASDLEKGTRTEAKRNAEYEAFIKAKQEELAAMSELKESKEQQKTEAETLLAQESQLYDDTEAQMNADIKFFDATKAACREKHSEWTARQSMRSEELAGIEKALEILTTDEARELFGHTIVAGRKTGTFFLQLASESEPARSAYEALKTQASKAHSLRLARIAAAVSTSKVGHFDKVLKAIDEMIEVLKDEEAADIKKKDQCIEEYKNTNSTISDLSWKISVNQAKIEKYEATIAQLKKDLVETEEAIVQTLKDIDEMLKQRTEENQAYLADKEDDMKAVGLLEQAKGYFSDYYKEHGYMSLAQKQPVFNAEPAFNISADEAPEVVFSHAGHRKDEASGIVKLFDVVLSDLREEMATSMKLEAEAQVAYEKANATATELLNSLEAKKVNLEESIAATNQLKAEETTLMENNEASLKDEEAYLASITPDCDWMIGSFDERDAKREAEMKGLTEAKTFLSQYYEKAQAAAQEEALTQVSSNLLASARPISPHRLH
mmetsp:Transcript_39572/g.88586  ORF Transcript_39572/g.88586 Transcript_39572/m.88586 type:complete len:709 (-) Transcript_39572:30-2156(-)